MQAIRCDRTSIQCPADICTCGEPGGVVSGAEAVRLHPMRASQHAVAVAVPPRCGVVPGRGARGHGWWSHRRTLRGRRSNLPMTTIVASWGAAALAASTAVAECVRRSRYGRRMDADTLLGLGAQLGQPVLAYLLGFASPRTDVLATASGFTPAQEAVLDVLRVTQQVRIREDDEHPHLTWSWLLVGPSGQEDRALGTALRDFAGGNVPAVDSVTTPLNRALTQMAIDAYPSLLLQESFAASQGAMPLLSLRNHSLHARFQSFAGSNRRLRPLMTIGSERGRDEDLLYRSTGNGMSFAPSLLAEQLINAAWAVEQLETETPSSSDLASRTIDMLDRTRRALHSTADVPARIGFTGVLLPEHTDSVAFGSARLRAANTRDTPFARMTGLDGGTSTTNGDGVRTSLTYAGDLVLELSTPFSFTIGRRTQNEPEVPSSPHTAQELDTVTENLRIGLLLSNNQRTPSVYPTWRAVLEPLNFGRSVGWEDPGRAVGLHPTRLTAAELAGWQTWEERVRTHRQHIGIAVRRLLLAVNDRTRPEDALLDAVIVWENLFGVRGATTEGVTDALASLLHRTDPERDAAKKRYRAIYSRRSDIVHGARTFHNATVQTTAADAITVSLLALRHLFEHRHDILALRTSKQRNSAARERRAT